MKRAAQRIPGCAQTFSKGPLSFVQGVAPNFVRKARGPYVWDVDGNRYVDNILGLGPVILGHADPAVNAAAFRQMEQGASFSLPHPLEVELAELLCELIPCAEMVRFGKNGSDATAAAVRAARGFTGRDKIARCGYHGWQDWYIGSTSRHLGVPQAVRDLTLVFPYNSLPELHALFQRSPREIACVIMEPVAFDAPQPGYLRGVLELCRSNGALLVFDEIVTGFRLHLGGAQAHFGVTPDLACFGKAMANGFPLSAVVGRSDVMRIFEQIFFSSTFGGEAVSLAASLETLRELRRREGIPQLWRTGGRLQEATNRLLAANALDRRLACVGLEPWTTLRCLQGGERDVLLLRSLFQQEAIRRGVLTHGNHMLSVSHDDAVIDAILSVYAEVFPILAEAIESGTVEACLAGPPLQTILRA
jgi:glutamate-1-semialdehyde aminotransferase